MGVERQLKELQYRQYTPNTYYFKNKKNLSPYVRALYEMNDQIYGFGMETFSIMNNNYYFHKNNMKEYEKYVE